MNINCYTSFVYAKCDVFQRQTLWEEIGLISNGMDFSWMISGDFNFVINGEEKIGGLPVVKAEAKDFKTMIESCELY